MERSLWQLPCCQILHFTVKHLNVDTQVFPVNHPNCLKEGLFMCFFTADTTLIMMMMMMMLQSLNTTVQTLCQKAC